MIILSYLSKLLYFIFILPILTYIFHLNYHKPNINHYLSFLYSTKSSYFNLLIILLDHYFIQFIASSYYTLTFIQSHKICYIFTKKLYPIPSIYFSIEIPQTYPFI